jgi:hypothetical protein
MSWNPRRFAAAAVDKLPRTFSGPRAGESFPTMIWVTRGAHDRIDSAVANAIIEHTEVPFPPTGVLIGLHRPVPLGNGLSAAALWVFGANAMRRSLELALQHAGDPRTLEAFRKIPGDVVPTRTIQMLTADMEVSGTMSVNAQGELLVLTAEMSERVRPALTGVPDTEPNRITEEDGKACYELLRAAWSLFNEPVETEVTATTVQAGTVVVGKRRKAVEQEVSVIDIRQQRIVRTGPVADSDPIERDHRWAVRGHWRNQPFGPGRAQRRRIWIEPYIAGPEDKPLKARPVVMVLR